MNHVIGKLIDKSNIVECVDDCYIERMDWQVFAEDLVKETIREVVKHLDKHDPDFNAYSRRVLSDHFGIKL